MSLLLGASIFSQPFLNFVLDPHNLICIWNLGGADIISLRCADEHITLSLSGGGEKSRQAPAGRGPGDGGAVRVSRPRAVTHGSRQHTRAEEVEVHCGGTTQPHAERTARRFFFLLLAQAPITV
jgi:hypothetical protein